MAEQIRSLGSNLILILPGSVASTGVRLGFGTRPTHHRGRRRRHRARDALRPLDRSLGARHATRSSGATLNWSTAIQGTTPDYEETRQWPVVSGRWFNQDEAEGAAKVVLLGQTVAENVFGGSDPVGAVVRVAGVPLTVIGVLDRKGQIELGAGPGRRRAHPDLDREQARARPHQARRPRRSTRSRCACATGRT